MLTIAWKDTNNGTEPTDASWSDGVVVTKARTGQIRANVLLPYDATTRGALSGGASHARSTMVQLPDGNPGVGMLNITVTTDIGNTVSEANSDGTGFTNNSSTVGVNSLLAPYPDLTVTNVALTPASGYNAGDTVSATWTLSNTGNADVTTSFSEQVSIKNLETGAVIKLLSDTLAASAGAPVASGAST